MSSCSLLIILLLSTLPLADTSCSSLTCPDDDSSGSELTSDIYAIKSAPFTISSYMVLFHTVTLSHKTCNMNFSAPGMIEAVSEYTGAPAGNFHTPAISCTGSISVSNNWQCNVAKHD